MNLYFGTGNLILRICFFPLLKEGFATVGPMGAYLIIKGEEGVPSPLLPPFR